MRHPLNSLLALWPVLVLSTSACDLINSAQANKALAATVVATPALDLAPLGVPFTVPPQTVAQVFFGQRDADPTKQPTAITGAAVTLAFDGKTFTLKDQGSGNYGLSTLEDATFVYVPSTATKTVHYKLSITSDGAGPFTAEVDGPPKDAIEQFTVLAGAPWPLTANTEVKLTRSNIDDPAFVAVIPASSILAGNKNPSYTDMPGTVLDLLDLIANDAPWHQKVITIPATDATRGTAFPSAGVYALTVSSVKKGTTSQNLFTASAFLVGMADVALVQVK
jgi:hypothetical protein